MRRERLIFWITSLSLGVACSRNAEQQQGTSSVLVDLGAGNQSAINNYNNLEVPCKNSDMVVSGFNAFNGNENVTEAAIEHTQRVEAGQDSGSGEQLGTSAGGESSTEGAAGTTSGDASSDDDTLAGGSGGSETDDTAPQSDSETISSEDIPGTGDSTGIGLVQAGGNENVRITQGTLTEGGKTYNVCYVTGAVNYETPALMHKVVQESGAGQVYNMGQRYEPLVESGGINNTRPNATVYDNEGRPLGQSNSSTKVIESDQQDQTVLYNWNTQEISQQTGIQAAGGPRPNNNYICNATGYILARSIQSQEKVEYLPGLSLPPLRSDIKQGFLHVGQDQSPQEVDAALRAAIRAQNGG